MSKALGDKARATLGRSTMSCARLLANHDSLRSAIANSDMGIATWDDNLLEWVAIKSKV